MEVFVLIMRAILKYVSGSRCLLVAPSQNCGPRINAESPIPPRSSPSPPVDKNNPLRPHPNLTTPDTTENGPTK
jgi:hypothetical protein